MKRYEIVTIGRRKDLPERDNARLLVIKSKRKPVIGTKWSDGDYVIEIIWFREI